MNLWPVYYTENQPDFTWLMPYEEKEFTQYFLPYRELGVVKNATKDLLMNIEPADNGKAHLKVFATNRQTVNITASCDNGCTLLDKTVTINPEKIFEQEIDTQGTPFESVSVKFVKDGRTIMEWPHRTRRNTPPYLMQPKPPCSHIR